MEALSSDQSSVQDSSVHPLSFAQLRIWFLNQLEPGNPAYNVHIALRLIGRLDLTVLGKSFNEIIRRHESLRTTFRILDSKPVQIVSKPQPLTIPVIDLHDLPESNRKIEAMRVDRLEAMKSFNLERGPLLRATLLRMGELEHVLLLTIHHVINDGWSTSIIFRELSILYGAFSNGDPSPLPELTTQYASFANWQRQYLSVEVLEKELSYWKRQLASPPILNLPTDRPRPAMQSYKGERQSFLIAHDLTNALKALSLQEGATLYMTLLTAFNVLLYRYTHQEDILVGSPIAGRTRVETEDLIGFFINPLVLRTDLSGNPSFRVLLARVRETALQAYTHQDLPFEKLVEALQPERSLSHTPLFQVWFAFQNMPTLSLKLPDVTTQALDTDFAQLDRGPRGTTRHDLRLGLSAISEGLGGSFEYRTDLFYGFTISRMVMNFQTLLESIVANPDAPLNTLVGILDEADSQQKINKEKDLEKISAQRLKKIMRKATG